MLVKELYPDVHFFNFARRKGITFRGESKGEITVGKHVALNDSVIDITGGVYIENNVHFGHQVMVLSSSHPTDILDGYHRRRILTCSPILIKEDAYIGSRAIVLEGVVIGKGAYVAAGAVVTKDIPPFELWGGVPAKFIRKVI
jgi:acetyltransferase-like isoleucine patch superfamily enzyme